LWDFEVFSESLKKIYKWSGVKNEEEKNTTPQNDETLTDWRIEQGFDEDVISNFTTTLQTTWLEYRNKCVPTGVNLSEHLNGSLRQNIVFL
jgi:hypothetical protein